MEPLVGIAVIVAGLVATTALLVLGVMVLRHPRLPAWLQTEGAAQAACFLLTTVLAGAVSAGIGGLVHLDVPINAYGAAALTVGVMLATAYLIGVLGHVGERLRRADAGGSPFAALPRPEHVTGLGLSPH
jgi:hypothetical protein